MLKQFRIPAILGVIKDTPSEDLPDEAAISVSNFIFLRNTFFRRGGLGLRGTLPTTDPITCVSFYDLIMSSSRFLLCTTTRDTFKYDGSWKFITRNLNTGTVTVGGDDKTVTLAGTTWPDWDDYPEGSICQIKFGTTDMNGTGTPDTWFPIDTWDSTTQLTLATLCTEAVSGAAYVIRLCWSGDEDDQHEIVYPVDEGTWDKLAVITNGKDAIQKWDGGSGTCTLLGGSPNLARHIGYFYNHLILGDITDTGTEYPQTVELADIGDPETWSAILYNLVDTDDKIMALKSFRGSLIIYKEKSIAVARATGDDEDPISIDENMHPIGTLAPKTICDVSGVQFFLGNDDVYMFDGSNVHKLADKIVASSLFRELNKTKINRAFAGVIPEESLYCLFIPTGTNTTCNRCYAYNWKTKAWQIWEFSGLTAGCPAYLDTVFKIGDLTGTIGDLTGTIGSYRTEGKQESLVLAGTSGKVYYYDSSANDDNGTSIEATLITKDYSINEVHQAFLLSRLTIGVSYVEAGSSLYVSLSTDYGDTWTDEVQIETTEDAFYEYIASFLIRAKRVRFKFRTTGKNRIAWTNVQYADAGE